MYTNLTIKELQYLDAFLKALVAASSEANLKLTIVISVDGNLIAGDFLRYDTFTPLVYKQNLHKHFVADVLNLCFNREIANRYSLGTTLDQTAITNNISHIDNLLQTLLTQDFFANIPEVLDALPPYIYNPTFITSNNSQLGFYMLEVDKTYKVVSILSQPAQN